MVCAAQGQDMSARGLGSQPLSCSFLCFCLGGGSPAPRSLLQSPTSLLQLRRCGGYCSFVRGELHLPAAKGTTLAACRPMTAHEGGTCGAGEMRARLIELWTRHEPH